MGISSNLPVCTGTASQGTIEDCTVECTISDMQPFTIHFRRPENNPTSGSGSKSNLYDGSYGFDWLRDEYVYNILDVFELVDMHSGVATPKRNRLYKGKVDKLIKEYIQLNSKDSKVKAENTKIKTKLGNTYIPSWLSIFPTTHVLGKSNNGVDLYIEVEQEEKLAASVPALTNPSGININFEADQGIDISVSGIKTLADLISGTSEEIDLNLDGPSSYIDSKKVKRYSDKSKTINITASAGIDDVRFIRVKATDVSKNCTKTVGLICIYPNGHNSIHHSDINFVPTLIAPLSKTYQLPTHTLNGRPFNINSFIENHFLNQALVSSNIQQAADFELFNDSDFIAYITKTYDYQSKTSFTSNPTNGKPTTINNRHHVPLYKKDSQGNYVVDSNGNLIKNNTLGLRDDLIDLYAKQQNTIFDDNDDNKQTYILLTDFYISDIGLDNQGEFDKTTLGGVTSGEVKTSGSSNHIKKWIEWGNFVLMFDDENENYDVISTVHELGHSFSLPHTFEIDDYTKHSFYKGYTDNIMDYSHKDVDPLFTNTTSDINTYDGQQFSLFKWQWEILRNDRSIKK